MKTKKELIADIIMDEMDWKSEGQVYNIAEEIVKLFDIQLVRCCTDDNSFYCNGELICTYGYDKRQNKYIAKHNHKSYERGFKFLYGNSPESIRSKIEKRINDYR